MKRFDIVGFGALNVDKLFCVNKIAGIDEEGFVTGYEEACGGSAANTVVGLARLDCKVGFIGKVANDREGKILIEDFRHEGVDTNGVIQSKSSRSGTAMGFVDPKGNRALYVDPGVNDTIKPREIARDYAFQTRFLHLTSFAGRQSFQAQQKLLEAASKNMRVSLDPGDLYAAKGPAGLEPLMKHASVIMPNQKELEMLTGAADYKKAAEIVLKKGADVVAVKMGANGCYVADGKESYHVKPFKTRVADTTGAGDAFNAGFLYGLLNGKDLYECGRLGNFVASRCIMKMGARAGLPRLVELKKRTQLFAPA